MTQKEKDQLLEEHSKLILYEARRYATNVPFEAMAVQAYNLAKKAADTYDPKVSKFSTHLVNSLQKLSRLSTEYGQVVRIPENQQFLLNKVNKAEQKLTAEFGREPTVQELADETKLGEQVIHNLFVNKNSSVNLANMDNMPAFEGGENEEWLHFVYHELPPRDKLILEHRLGMAGKPQLNNQQIAKKLKLSEAVISNRWKLIREKIHQGWK